MTIHMWLFNSWTNRLDTLHYFKIIISPPSLRIYLSQLMFSVAVRSDDCDLDVHARPSAGVEVGLALAV